MALIKTAPAQAILRRLGGATAAASCFQHSPQIQIRCESSSQTPSDQPKSFKGQLYESTAARTEREREERRRFARERGEGAGGRNAAMTFGATLLNVFVPHTDT
jgi:D-lactate dehydrogenase (cytochrome)